jgi:hypothetical protein
LGTRQLALSFADVAVSVELFIPPYDTGTQTGLARYGSLIDHFDFARVQGRLYLKTCYVTDPSEWNKRIHTAEEAVTSRLWRRDSSDWPHIREQLRCRLVGFSQIDPTQLNFEALRNHIDGLQKIFAEGALQHFVQQPSSMFPVGDWIRNVRTWTGCAQAEAVSLLIGSHTGSADFLGPLDRLDEYADRIITGFRHRRSHAARVAPSSDGGFRLDGGHTAPAIGCRSSGTGSGNARNACRLKTAANSTAAFPKHGSLRITRRRRSHHLSLAARSVAPALLAAAGQLIDQGRIGQSDHIFQATPSEVEALLADHRNPADQSWHDEPKRLPDGKMPNFPLRSAQRTSAFR